MLSDLDDSSKGIRSIMSQAAAVSSSRPVPSFVLAQRPAFQQRLQPVQQLEAPPSYPQIMPPLCDLGNSKALLIGDYRQGP